MPIKRKEAVRDNALGYHPSLALIFRRTYRTGKDTKYGLWSKHVHTLALIEPEFL